MMQFKQTHLYCFTQQPVSGLWNICKYIKSHITMQHRSQQDLFRARGSKIVPFLEQVTASGQHERQEAHTE